MHQTNVSSYDVFFRKMRILHIYKHCPVIDIKWPVKLDIDAEFIRGIKYHDACVKKNLFDIQLVVRF